MTSAESPIQRLQSVADALDAVADAAAAADTTRLSACEDVLGAATAAMPTPEELSGADIAAVRNQVQRIRFAMDRCRAIGRAANELITTTLSAQGKAPAYLPSGVGAQASRISGQVEARV
ncbi:MAG: hypothetical protein U0Q11_01975 [Vicinamibacterales bacterium]